MSRAQRIALLCGAIALLALYWPPVWLPETLSELQRDWERWLALE